MTSVLHDLVDQGAVRAREAKRRRRTLDAWLEEEVSTDNGRWSWRDHEPLKAVFDVLHEIVTERITDASVTLLKAEQLGASTGAIGFVTWLAAELGHNVGYFLPTDKFASEFGASRVKPVVEGSSLLSAIIKDASVDRGQLKELDGAHLRILGLESMLGSISSPMDAQVFDEVDFIPTTNRRWARGRLMHSSLRLQFKLSAPYRPGSGIDAAWHEGSQRKYVLRCPKCRKDNQVLEELFPECMAQRRGKWERACAKCHSPFDLARDGRWVAAFPEREKADRKYSFRLSAISMPAISADHIMAVYKDALDDPDEMSIFNRSKRALPDAGAMQPITDAEIRRMQRPYSLVIAPQANPVFFGIDMGNACWFWAEEWLPEGRPRLIWAEKINSDHFVERVGALITKIRPRFGITDAHPLLTDARKLAYIFPERVALQNFITGRELTVSTERHIVEGTIGSYGSTTNPTYQLVTIDRNDALDQFCRDATHPDHGLLLPDEQTPVMRLVAEHLKKLQREMERDARGNTIARYLADVPNHFGMAACSARLARLVAPSIIPWSSETHVTVPQQTRRSRGAIGRVV
jgi:hypothetical protein